MVLLVPLWVGGLASANPSHRPGHGDGQGPRPTIVLVHGDWADGSSWNGVIERLQRRGYTVVAPPNPLRGPTSDAAYLASYLQTTAQQRVMSTSAGARISTVDAGHLSLITRPDTVTGVIENAAQATS